MPTMGSFESDVSFYIKQPSANSEVLEMIRSESLLYRPLYIPIFSYVKINAAKMRIFL